MPTDPAPAQQQPGEILFTESSPRVGGQELQLLQQLVQLAAAGETVTLACRPAGAVAAAARECGIATLPVAFRNSLHPPSVRQLAGFLRSRRPWLAMCHSAHDTNNLALACRLARLLPGAGGAFAGPVLLRAKTYLAGKGKAWTYNRLVDATLVPSAYLRQALLASNPAIRPERVQVLYPGIDFARLDANASAPLTSMADGHPQRMDHPRHACSTLTLPSPWPLHPGLADASGQQAATGPLLLHVAMLREEKGHLLMLDVVQRLRTRWPGLRYLIVGDGPMRAPIEAAVAAAGLQAAVILAGAVVPAHALFRHADLLVMPSVYEPLGMAQIEALALGIPVVASDTGGIPETVRAGHSGLLVPPGDVSAWTAAIDSALQQPEMMRALARNGSADVRTRFSAAANLAQLRAIARQQRRTAWP